MCLRLGGFVEEWTSDVTGTVAEKENGVCDDFLGVTFFVEPVPIQYKPRHHERMIKSTHRLRWPFANSRPRQRQRYMDQ